MDVVEHCLAGDETAARAAGDAVGSVVTYPATKLAIARWVRRQAPTAEWAGAGITMNAVAPGKVETPLLAETRRDTKIGRLVDEFPVPLGRSGMPDELAGVVHFLLGPNARFFCGSVVFVDGGTDAELRSDDFPTPLDHAAGYAR